MARKTTATVKLIVMLKRPEGSVLDAAAKIGTITVAKLDLEVEIPIGEDESMQTIEERARAIFVAAAAAGSVEKKKLSLPRHDFTTI